VANPGVGIQSTQPARGSASATEAAASREECPRCGEAVQPSWQYCPFCNVGLAVPLSSGAVREGYPDRHRREDWTETPLDVEVQRDTSLVGAGLIALGVLGFIGLFTIVLGGNFDWDPGVILVLGAGLIVVVLVGVVRVARKSQASGARAGTAFAGGCATALMGAALGVLVFLLAIAQAFQNCSKGSSCGYLLPLQDNYPLKSILSKIFSRAAGLADGGKNRTAQL
jgi:hypothetical protein